MNSAGPLSPVSSAPAAPASSALVAFAPSSNLCGAFRREVSWNGFRIDELKSGLQKYVRRGMLPEALFCAAELDLFKHAAERGEALRTNFLHRLMIIFLEDVGVAALALWPALDAALTQLQALRRVPVEAGRKCGDEEALVAAITQALCAAAKARSCSHARAVSDTSPRARSLATHHHPSVAALHARFDAEAADAPDFFAWCARFEAALVARSYTAVHWAWRIALAEVRVVEYRKSKPVWRLFRILERVLSPRLRPLHAVAMRWYAELEGTKEAFTAWMVLVLAFLTDAPFDAPGFVCAPELPSCVEARAQWARSRAGTTHTFESFVLDRHTRAGRGTSAVEFALVGALVANESAVVVAEHKRFYEDLKRVAEGGGVGGAEHNWAEEASLLPPSSCAAPASTGHGAGSKTGPETGPETGPKTGTGGTCGVKRGRPDADAADAPATATATQKRESEAFELLVRAQLTTGHAKCDVYFARDVGNGTTVVVKGPLPSVDAATRSIDFQAWKRAHGIPALDARLVWLVPDRWPEGVPLGVRNRVDRTRPAPFLVSASLVDAAALRVKTHSSKLWPPTAVADWTARPLHLHWDALTPLGKRDYVAALLARYAFGISDLADRNFLVAQSGRVVSVDEECRGRRVDFAVELKKTRCAHVRAWLDAHFDELDVGAWGLACFQGQGEGEGEGGSLRACRALFNA